MSPYRTAAKREVEPSRFDWNFWVFGPARTFMVIFSFLFIYLGINALLAAGAQFVVTGFAGHPIGSFWHYMVASVLLGLLRGQVKVKENKS